MQPRAGSSAPGRWWSVMQHLHAEAGCLVHAFDAAMPLSTVIRMSGLQFRGLANDLRREAVAVLEAVGHQVVDLARRTRARPACRPRRPSRRRRRSRRRSAVVCRPRSHPPALTDMEAQLSSCSIGNRPASGRIELPQFRDAPRREDLGQHRGNAMLHEDIQPRRRSLPRHDARGGHWEGSCNDASRALVRLQNFQRSDFESDHSWAR